MTFEIRKDFDFKTFILQSADGILYDLSLLEEVIDNYKDRKRCVRDYTIAKTIRALKDRIEELEAIK